MTRWAAVGLSEAEYREVCELLGREPNDLELGLYGVMWSEHCSYKHSRAILKRLPTQGERVIQGPGENAGVIRLGDGWAVAFKIESHNHPSFVEPFQGAATGVGGILRDVFTMGARPIAILDALRFGDPAHPRTRHLFQGVVAGIGFYGNCIGIPTVGGETFFDAAYNGNILVNAMCVGLLREDELVRGAASGVGNKVFLVGARTGRDGIHGASLLASAEFNEKSEDKRPSVQVGDPFMEKLLLEACLELKGTGALAGIQDLGAAGLTSASSETASRAGNGIELDVSRVPRREPGMTPYEVMLSESQERMLAIVNIGWEDAVLKVFEKWGLDAAEIGVVTSDGLLRVRDGDQVVAEVPARTLAEAPVCSVPPVEPEAYRAGQDWSPRDVTVPPLRADAYGEWLERLLSSPNIASKAWIYRQYDHQVLTNTVVLPGSDAAVIRVRGTSKALALATDCPSRMVALDPFIGAAMAVAEAARNVTCAGAEPTAITNCLNFGNPEKGHIAWQFERAIDGMAEACNVLGTPVTGGNVSFYNETSGQAIHPTPMIGMVGILDDLSHRRTLAFVEEGDRIALLGLHSDELGGSEYLQLAGGGLGGRAPRLDLQREKAVQQACRLGIRAGLIRSAHDVADGGLAVCLAESCFAGSIGCEVAIDLNGAIVDAPGQVPDYINLNSRPDGLLFGEAPSRIVVTCRAEDAGRLEQIAAEAGAPLRWLGRVGGERLVIRLAGRALVDEPVSRLKSVWEEAIPRWMGG